MKPKYLMQEAIADAVWLIAFGIAVIAVSLNMAFSTVETKDIVLVVIASAAVLVLAAHSIKNCRYCLLDEKGITFYLRFKPDTFVSWESITEVKCFEHGFGRSYQKNILVFNDKYSVQPLSPSDINEENYARGFLVRLSNDESFAEYLSHYRADLKIEY